LLAEATDEAGQIITDSARRCRQLFEWLLPVDERLLSAEKDIEAAVNAVRSEAQPSGGSKEEMILAQRHDLVGSWLWAASQCPM